MNDFWYFSAGILVGIVLLVIAVLIWMYRRIPDDLDKTILRMFKRD